MCPVALTFHSDEVSILKLPVAPESKSALTECTSLVSVVLTSIGRMIDVPRASRVLMESHLGNLFSHFGFWGCVVLSGAEGGRRGTSIGSQISVLTSFTSNTANLLTSSDWGALFTGHAKQNPPPGLNKPPLPLLHPLRPLNLQSTPPSALQLTSRHPNSGGSPSQDGWPLCTDSNLAEVRSVVTPLENFLRKCNMEYTLYPWISLFESTLETSYKPQT